MLIFKKNSVLVAFFALFIGLAFQKMFRTQTSGKRKGKSVLSCLGMLLMLQTRKGS